ncbi:molybdenum cofactor biosynthesis protein 1 b [Colletotrichum karsti]|uniref:Molybdenum cofactor biosynthesis protein 1 b n=1 Tax=Colletotrichum karsti TaxID=1095194 RepID=A0A9P6I4F4_9PEZI|nr:molybdenum cofactor biosynthesis protein 1 b [Colletotrichum karsti]KAF9875587.1 molybdenum cofactor biosynthesis protein 1 b [Colletotrichum karsti]
MRHSMLPRSALRRGQLSWHRRPQSLAQARCLNAAAAAQVTPNPQGQPLPRRELIKDAKPFSDFLTDNFHRQHDYLRISVTERCNLRCVYCMPEEGVPLSPMKELLTTPEIVLLSSVFVSQGVSKIRLTGGEPTVRRDIVPLMHQIGALRPHGLKELCLTTNGLSLHRKLDSMVEAGLTGINLSLDTLDPHMFTIMTRRNGFDAVKKSIDRIFELNKHGAGIKFKINCVVMRGRNDHEIVPFVEMTREKDVEVRFIEYMPFDGNKWNQGKMLGYAEMLDMIREKYPSLEKVKDHKNDTSKTWRIPGHAGKIGFITSMTHNFCGTCNRLRITSDGNLKVCLFGNTEVSLRDILRKSNNGDPIDEKAFEAMKQIEMDRRQGLADAEKPLGAALNEAELLDVIGMAVKRKKEKHAGIGELEHMKNRPMILIDSQPLSSYTTRAPEMPKKFMSPNEPTGFSLTSRPTGISGVPTHLLYSNAPQPHQLRLFSSTPRNPKNDKNDNDDPKLTHVSPTGAAYMVSITAKQPTTRLAKAACTVTFSSPLALRLIRANQVKKGDVLGAARIAGIMAAKRTPDIIPLCHPIALSHVAVELEPEGADETGAETVLHVRATVECDGKTGVEMEALTAASAAALTVYDMCKAVDKGMIIGGLRVVLKEGGKSGRWEMP